jgi:putative endonuclease
MPFVYILQCRDQTYYTGYAVDLDKRLQEHQQGIGCKYTRGRLPVELVYWEEYPSKSQAMQREHQIKQFSRDDKTKLIHGSPCKTQEPPKKQSAHKSK